LLITIIRSQIPKSSGISDEEDPDSPVLTGTGHPDPALHDPPILPQQFAGQILPKLVRGVLPRVLRMIPGTRKSVGSIVDITDLKRTEEELRRENRSTLVTLMDNLQGMVYRCRNDPD